MFALREPNSRRRSRQGTSQRLHEDERGGFSTATPALSLRCLVFSRNSSCCLAAVSLPWVSTFPLFLLSFGVSVYSAHIGTPLTPLGPTSAATFCYCCTKSRTGCVLVSKSRKGMWHFTNCAFLWQSLICMKDCLGCANNSFLLTTRGRSERSGD